MGIVSSYIKLAFNILRGSASTVTFLQPELTYLSTIHSSHDIPKCFPKYASKCVDVTRLFTANIQALVVS